MVEAFLPLFASDYHVITLNQHIESIVFECESLFFIQLKVDAFRMLLSIFGYSVFWIALMGALVSFSQA